MKNAQLANCKASDIFFADTDGYVWFAFGQNNDVILAERVLEDGLGPLVSIPHDRFSHVVKKADITFLEGESTYRVQPKRQSTTAKVTRKIARLIGRYIEETGHGVIVRKRGQEYGVVNTFDDYRGFEFAFPWDDAPGCLAKECTILKTTIQAIESELETIDNARSVSIVGRLLKSFFRGNDVTIGKAEGRFIVSRSGGLCLSLSDYYIDVIDHVTELVETNPNAETFGVWKDEDNYLWVDANDSFDCLEEAEAIGKERKQLAIFDTETGVVIDL